MKIGDIILIQNLIKEIDLNNKIGIITNIEDLKYIVKLYNYKKKIVKLNKKFLKQIFPKTLLIGGINNINNDLLLEYFSTNDKIIKINNIFNTINLKNNTDNFLLKKIITDPLIIKNNKLYTPYIYFDLLNNYEYFSDNILYYNKLYKVLKKLQYEYFTFIFIDGLLYKNNLDKLANNWIMFDIII